MYNHKTKDRVTRTPLKTGGEFMRSGKVSSSCSNSGIKQLDRNLLFFIFWLGRELSFLPFHILVRNIGIVNVDNLFYSITPLSTNAYFEKQFCISLAITLLFLEPLVSRSKIAIHTHIFIDYIWAACKWK
jgi:hypothetical protein